MTRKARPAADAGALDPERLFARLAARRGLIVAVSGGPDSTALMLLISRWRKRPPTLIVTVDHGLRAESADEARLVAKNAGKLKLPCRIMTISKPRAGGNLQDWARRERYACIIAAAQKAGYDTIVTAHHRDDQAETFLLRLARGSGVYGLAAMREEESLGEVTLARPLLGVARESIGRIASESGLKTVADPSNLDVRFDRVRVRALMPALAAHGLDAARLAETSALLGRAAKALDHYAGVFVETHFNADAFGVVTGLATAFATIPEEVGLRALALILRAVGGADYTPRLAAIESLFGAIGESAGVGKLKRTLSGVVVEVVGGRLAARREWGRAGLREVSASAGATLLWDGRFEVEVPDFGGELAVGALGDARLRLRSIASGRNALRTLPGLYRRGTLLAAPAGVEAADGSSLAVLPVECIVAKRLGIRGDSLQSP